MKKILVFLMLMLFLTGCGASADSSDSALQQEEASAQNEAEVSAEETDVEAEETEAEVDEAQESESSSDEESLLAAAEQGDPFSNSPAYTVEDGVLYYGGEAVTEETKTLDLRDSDIADYSFLENYSWIESLLIDDPDLYDLDFLQSCTNLRALTLNCSAADFQSIGALTQLMSLDIQSPNLTNLDFLRSLSLNNFLCSYNENLEDISGLEDMASLTFLSLFQCRAVSDFSVLSSLTGLEQLVLSGTQFSDLQQISSLSALTSLSIEECSVDYDQFSSAEYHLASLQCSAGAETVSHLHELFPDCTIN